MGENMPWKVQVSAGSTVSDISEQAQEFSREGSTTSSSVAEADEKPFGATVPMKPDATSALAVGCLSTMPKMPVTPPPGLEPSADPDQAIDGLSEVQPTLGQEDLRGYVQELQQKVQSLQQELLCQQVCQLNSTLQATRSGLPYAWLPETQADVHPMSGMALPMVSPFQSWVGYGQSMTGEEYWPATHRPLSSPMKPKTAPKPAALGRQFCTACGARLKQPVARFCTDCGHKLD